MRASVCLSVCMLVTTLSPAKEDEPISMSFWRQTCVGPSNRVLDVGPDPPTDRAPCTRHPLDNVCVQYSRPPDVTNST